MRQRKRDGPASTLQTLRCIYVRTFDLKAHNCCFYQSSGGNRFALLIEDKVDANLQPDQAKRYRLRAEKEQASGEYSDFEIILCAPKQYIDQRHDLDGFERKISFEQIADIIEQSHDTREHLIEPRF
jgi:hypothetical protein